MKRFSIAIVMFFALTLALMAGIGGGRYDFGIWNTSAEVRAAIDDEVGDGLLVFGGDNHSYELVSKILHICADPLAVWAWITPATTEQDLTIENHDATYQNMETTDQAAQGLVWSLELGGTDEYLTVTDHADFSFLSGTDDADVSIGGWVEVYDSGATKVIISKYDNSNSRIEWDFYFDGNENLILMFRDQSATAREGRITDSPLAVGWRFVVATFDSAQQGTSASDGMVLYVDGIAVASSVYDDGTYVDKENLAADVLIGSRIAAALDDFWIGKLGVIFIDQSTLSAATVWELYIATRGYYGQ